LASSGSSSCSFCKKKVLGNRQGQHTDRLPRQTYKQAKKILQFGSDELIDTVDQGRLAISAACDINQLPFSKQKEILTGSRQEINAYVNRLRYQHQSYHCNDTTSIERQYERLRKNRPTILNWINWQSH
jgi:hypothetical protein